MHIKSESGDNYLELFVDKTVEEIKQRLYDNIEMYEPVCEYDTAFDDNTTPSERKEVDNMLSSWYDHSWDRAEENDY